MHSTIGIKEIFLIPKGLAGSFIAGNAIDGVLGFSFREGAELKIEPIDTTNDFKERPSGGRTNFVIEGTSQMNNFDYLWYLMGFIGVSGSDIVVLTEGYQVDAQGYYTSPNGIFVFTGQDYMSPGFTYTRDLNKQVIKVTNTVSLSDDRAELILQTASTQAVKLNIGYKKGYRRPDYIVKPEFYSAKAYGLNGGTTMDDLFLQDELIDCKYVFSTEGNKLAANRTRIKWIKTSFELTTSDANCSKIVKLNNLPFDSAFELTDKIGINTYAKYVIETGALFSQKNFLVGDTDRNSKVSLTGNVYLSEFIIRTLPTNILTIKAF